MSKPRMLLYPSSMLFSSDALTVVPVSPLAASWVPRALTIVCWFEGAKWHPS